MNKGSEKMANETRARGNGRTRLDVVALAVGQRSCLVWFRARVGAMGGRIRKIMIVGLARKLLVALWHYVKDGVIPDGAKLKAA